MWADIYPDSSQVVQTGETTEGEKLKDLTNTFSVADERNYQRAITTYPNKRGSKN